MTMLAEKKVKTGTIGVVRDDITTLDIQAFVYYAQHDLKLGSGFGNAIASRGGPGIQKELDQLDALNTCDTVVTDAGNLKAEFIIHAVGPRFQEEDLESKLQETTVRVLKSADEKGIERLALPPMGTGFYGVPVDVAARVTLKTIKEHLEKNNTKLKEVVICVQDPREIDPFKLTLERLS